MLTTTLFIFTLLQLQTALGDDNDNYTPIIITKSGQLKGIYVQAEGSNYRCPAYFGIPFAKPPVAELRFRPTEPVEAWEGVRNADKHGAECRGAPHKTKISLPRSPYGVSEDCLFLNIVTPPDTTAGDKKAVMVWIHGGGFVFGASSMVDHSEICRNFVTNDVIVVTINYRLGYFGFLASGDEAATGNWGLYDQIEALK